VLVGWFSPLILAGRARHADHSAEHAPDRDDGAAPQEPFWKRNLLILVGLYPLVMLHTLFVAPHLRHLGTALAVLIGTATTVALLGWPVLPLLRRRMSWWLAADPHATRRTHLVGALILIVGTAATALVLGLMPATHG
jgi:hypothetical protein